MRHIKITNDVVHDYTIDQLLKDYPDAVIYKNSQMPDEKLLANYDVYPLITEPFPQLAEDETADEGIPEFEQGEWHQTWVVRKLTKDEIQKIIDSRSTDPVATATDTGYNVFFATNVTQTQRYEICKTCPSFTSLKTCKECGCIMPLKTKLSDASCPLSKW